MVHSNFYAVDDWVLICGLLICHFQVETCNTQARSLAALINTRSPVLRSDPFLAHLVVANTTISYKVPYVHTVATESVKDAEVSGCSQVGVAFQTLLLSLVLCLLNASIRWKLLTTPTTGHTHHNHLRPITLLSHVDTMQNQPIPNDRRVICIYICICIVDREMIVWV